MNGFECAGITRAIVWPLLLVGGINLCHAKTLESAVTIQRVTALIEQAKRNSIHYSLTGRLLPHDWEGATPSWRPVSDRHNRPRISRRAQPVSSVVRQLVSDAICKRNEASIRVAHRLDGFLGGQLFGHDEALIANEVARRQQLSIYFRPPLAVLAKQTLIDINRRRRLKRVLSEEGPENATRLVRSFYLLCNVGSVR